MSTDDHPIVALESQLRMEDLGTSPITSAVLKFFARFPLPQPVSFVLKTFAGHLAADSLDRIWLFLKVFRDTILQHEAEINKIRELHERKHQERVDSIKELVLDGARKAENTRAKERIERLGLILGNAVSECVVFNADEIEEQMRVAMNLSQSDVQWLAELVRIEGSLLDTHDHIDRYNAHQRWEQGSWGGPVNPELTSAFNKLESYGLVSRVAPPNNLNILADFQNRYVLLPKGKRFAALAKIQIGEAL